jgi:hypothetical protein
MSASFKDVFNRIIELSVVRWEREYRILRVKFI